MIMTYIDINEYKYNMNIYKYEYNMNIKISFNNNINHLLNSYIIHYEQFFTVISFNDKEKIE